MSRSSGPGRTVYTRKDPLLAKDRPSPILSTEYAIKLCTKWLRPVKKPCVKAVNGNSMREKAELSHVSVDNQV
ncbi:hypothetical protein B1H58_11255 [Pantoea alhagi]|uniref:Uncharacterized protein n=1 Tax=Pantoea alhagi TaxID=1891675 RepID=A0A1W6BAW8_9GAMM|nr:hypothetical protein B1H58_11255 [Pantoea alhagi]